MGCKVSIIVPTYNSSATFEACLDAVKKQTYCSYEVIMVDNLSTDSMIDIARKFEVRIITQ